MYPNDDLAQIHSAALHKKAEHERLARIAESGLTRPIFRAVSVLTLPGRMLLMLVVRYLSTV